MPDIPQAIVNDLASRAEGFVERARNGGSWIELHTWLVSMQPSYDALLGIGMDGLPRTARMPIPTETQEAIMAEFEVPDSVPTDSPSPVDTGCEGGFHPITDIVTTTFVDPADVANRIIRKHCGKCGHRFMA